MHKLNILIYGPESFLSSLIELKEYFKFSINSKEKNLIDKYLSNYDGFICHEQNLNQVEKTIYSIKCFKVLATREAKNNIQYFDHILKLPTSVKEINDLIESSAVKKKFNLNSSIKIKSYSLNKNEKKLSKDDDYITLTEKEVQLLDLIMTNKKALSKNYILSSVWGYASDADTHTVETHIYRLRKKIKEKFSDDKFIFNTKYGYCL